MKNLIKSALHTKFSESILRKVGKSPAGFRFLNRLSQPRGVYKTIGEAEAMCRTKSNVGHNDQDLIQSNFELSVKRRVSDYPALLWLEYISRKEKLRVFDFGGGIGQTYVQYAQVLDPSRIENWLVMDLAEVVEAGLQSKAKHNDPRLNFTTALTDCKECNVFFAAGALHYWMTSMADLDKAVGGLPPHFIVNRSPMHTKGEEFYSTQIINDARVVCKVRSAPQFEKEMSGIQFTCVDRWPVTEKSLIFSWLPDYSVLYRGAYLSRAAGSR